MIYTYIDDAVEATMIAATHIKALGEAFNIGTGVDVSVNSIVDIFKANFSGVVVNYVKERDIDNIRRRCIDIRKIHEKLNWSPKVNLKNGLNRTIEWFKSS